VCACACVCVCVCVCVCEEMKTPGLYIGVEVLLFARGNGSTSREIEGDKVDNRNRQSRQSR
jgi:hypothetical protein